MNSVNFAYSAQQSPIQHESANSAHAEYIWP